MRHERLWRPALCSCGFPPSCTLRQWFTTHRSGISMLGGGAAPEGNHLFIGLPHPLGADTTRLQRDANLQCWHACSTCHNGLLAVVTSASQGAVLSGAVPPETRHHSRVVVVSVEYSSRTLPRCWQLCRKCTLTAPFQLSLSRLNHWLPGGETHPEVVQGTAEFHHEITDPL